METQTGCVLHADGKQFFGLCLALALVSCSAFTACAHPLWPVALGSRSQIDFSAPGIICDSYNSQDAAKSTNGRYDPAKCTGDNADLLALSGTVYLAPFDRVYGHIYTGYSPSILSYAAVGEHAWQSTNSGVEPGWLVFEPPYVPPPLGFPDTSAPGDANSWASSNGGDVVTLSNFVSAVSTNSPSYTVPAQGGVVTNIFSYSTNANLPDPMRPGLITNTTSITVAVYPGSQPGLQTNTGWVTNHLVLPLSGTYLGAIQTNTITVTTSNLTSPIPSGLVTNIFQVTGSATLPNPVPAGTTTNIITVNTTASTYPRGDTYVGNIITNWNGGHTHVDSYTYNRITGYTYNFPIYSYAFPVDAYTYEQITGYSFFATTFSWPNFIYTWNLYTTNIVSTTKTYQRIFFSNQNYAETSLSGSTLILGQKAAVFLPNGLTGTEQIVFQPVGDTLVKIGGDWVPISVSQPPTLLVYAGGTNVVLNNTSIIDPSGIPASFVVYCAPSVKSLSIEGTGSLSGVLVAPNATLSLNGSGNNFQDFSGSIFANSISVQVNAAFHFDESLADGSFGPPWIAVQPVSQAALAGWPVTLSVEARGAPPLNYQWQLNGSNIPGATASTFSIASASTNDAGIYSVVVSNSYSYATVTSSAAALRVLQTATARLAGSTIENGKFAVWVQSAVGLRYVIEASTDLVRWDPIRTNIMWGPPQAPDNAPPYRFIDQASTNFLQRYYRVVYRP